MLRSLSIAFLFCLIPGAAPAQSAAPPRPARPTPPTRDPHTPGYVEAKELPDGAIPPANRRRQLHHRPHAPPRAGNDRAARCAPRHGHRVHHELRRQQDLSRHRPRARHLRHARSHRPRQAHRHHQPPRALHAQRRRLRPQAIRPRHRSRPSSSAPTAPTACLFTALDNLIAEHKVPVMIAISIGNGGGDAQGSERGLEYDTMSGRYAEFVEKEVLPRVEAKCNVKLTKIPTAAPPWAAAPAAPARSSWPGITPSSTTASSPTPAPTSISSGPTTRRPRTAPGSSTSTSSPTARASPSASGWKSATAISQSQRHARQHARLGRRQRKHGQGARRQGLSLPVRLRPQRRPHRPRRQTTDPARSPRIRLAGLSHRSYEKMIFIMECPD